MSSDGMVDLTKPRFRLFGQDDVEQMPFPMQHFYTSAKAH